MAFVAGACSLISLDAVVIDTETTGLDPANARVVEVAAVSLAVGRLLEQAAFRHLVRPDEPIPVEATRIHGIDQATVASALPFSKVWPQFAAYAGDGVLIGYAVGFDIAVLTRECERAGITWQPGASLDVALLAEVVEPKLAGQSLDGLAAWLGFEITGRHSAAGDAAAAARIFLALIPRLRARGIRTLGEAMRASSHLTGALDRQYQAGWAQPGKVPRGDVPSRIDTYPYRHRVGAIMSSPPRSVSPDAPVRIALEVMACQRISSLLVFPPDAPSRPEQAGIVTERDVLRTLSIHGAAALAMPVQEVMSAPVIAVPADAFAYIAIGRMNRLKIRHLGVTGATGELVGVLSARDLLRLRAESEIQLGDQIEQAKDVCDLGLAWSRLPGAARDLRREGLSAREIAAVISHQLSELTRQAVVLAERLMKDEGFGSAPCRYAFVVLGSAGRCESLLAMDQDNALIYECDEASDHVSQEVDRWFASLGTHVADILHQAGVPYCPGGVMAKNPQWRGSLGTWRTRVGQWIERASPQDLLTVDIFFDLLGVHGAVDLVDSVRRSSLDAVKGQAGFAKLLVEASGARLSVLRWFGGFYTDGGRIDLKKSGVFPIVSAARALAICHGIPERATPARLAGVKSLGLGMESDLDALDDAHALFLELILRQQIDDIEQGLQPTNTIEVKLLTRRECERLRAALRAVEPVNVLVRDLLF